MKDSSNDSSSCTEQNLNKCLSDSEEDKKVVSDSSELIYVKHKKSNKHKKNKKHYDKLSVSNSSETKISRKPKHNYYNCETETFEGITKPFTLIKGDRGDKGEQGQSGLRGERGKRGPRGYNGKQGNTGPCGKRGRKGHSFVWRGQWCPEHEYKKNDVVYFCGSSYIAVCDKSDSEWVEWEIMVTCYCNSCGPAIAHGGPPTGPPTGP
jgi:hypothetical protein